MNSSVVLTTDSLEQVVEYFQQFDAFAFDAEAVGEYRGEPTENIVTWISLATEGATAVIPMGHPNGDELLQPAIRKLDPVTRKYRTIPPVYSPPPKQLRPAQVWERLEPLMFSDRIKVAHNAVYDLVSLAKYYDGKIPPPPHNDTIVMQWLLDENLAKKGLKDRIHKVYGVDYDDEHVGRQVEAFPFWKVAHYSFMDARYTWLLWRRLDAMLQDAGLDPVARLEHDLIEVLCAMKQEGINLDIDRLHELDKDLAVRIEEAEDKIYRLIGRTINLNSPIQKSKALYAPKPEGQGLKPKLLTDNGKKHEKSGKELGFSDYSTSSDALELLGKNKVALAILDYQTLAKIHSTYVLGYLGVEGDPKRPCRILSDEKVHGDLVQYGTVTGRFSARSPNLQNIPRPDSELGKSIRELFISPPGFKFVVADYGQLEMVMLAHFAGRGALFDGLQEGYDPHSATAAALAGMEVKAFTELLASGDPSAKNARQAAKAINFAIVFGAGIDKVAAMAGITVTEAKRFLSIHRKKFPEIYRLEESIIEQCRSRRPPHINTLLGRKRRLPVIFAKDKEVRAKAERQAVNSLIQGSATGDLIKFAMIRLYRSLEPGMKLVLNVHDELVTLTPESKADRCAELVREAMTGPGIQELVKVPLTIDLHVVDRWSEAKS